MTNPVLENMKTRRSIRSYLPRQVEAEKLDLILEAGTYAPTGMGAQSPVIVAVQDPETVQKLAKINASILKTDSNPYYGAPTLLLVLADAQRGTRVEDGSCVLENMMLAAHSLGLGSCWIHRARCLKPKRENSCCGNGGWISRSPVSAGWRWGIPTASRPSPNPAKKVMW